MVLLKRLNVEIMSVVYDVPLKLQCQFVFKKYAALYIALLT